MPLYVQLTEFVYSQYQLGGKYQDIMLGMFHVPIKG